MFADRGGNARAVGWGLGAFAAADVRFGLRQLWKRKVTTLAAVVSLALAIGSRVWRLSGWWTHCFCGPCRP